MAVGSLSSGDMLDADHALWIPFPASELVLYWCDDCRNYSALEAGVYLGDRLYTCRQCKRTWAE